MTDVVLVLTTVPAGALGEAMARTLIEERLAACVNLSAPMVSCYRWKGTIEQDEERQLVIKTTAASVPGIRERIAQLHTYEMPEFLVIPVADGTPEYLGWIRTEVL